MPEVKEALHPGALDVQALMDGRWFLDIYDELYIVSRGAKHLCDILGNDFLTIRCLAEKYFHKDMDSVDQEDVAKRMNMEYVPPENRRYDPDSGFIVVP
jgi:hypothetical protein